MNSDHHFLIGASHSICEDFASSREGFAALADGCSVVMDSDGNKITAHTDIGARLLVRSAFHHRNIDSVDLFHDLVLNTADGYRRHMDLPAETLSATLLTLRSDNKRIRATCCGDGMIAARERGTGYWATYQYVYPTRPYYLRYRLGVVPVHESPLEIIRFQSGVKSESIGRLVSCLSFPKDECDLVIAMSDGSSSFTSGNKSVEFNDELLKRLLDFRRLAGRFALRHLKGVMKELAQDGIIHQDDISLIAIHEE